MRRTRRLSAVESLEPRLALSVEGIAFGDSPYLTLSFAPDGTNVNGRSNALFSYMNQIAAATEWQKAIIDAFQSWALHTNADIATVPDGGQPFGVAGQTLGDPRFGDVRVGAIRMRPDVYAVAVSRGFVSGTWSGDLLFNTRANLANVDDVFRVALHEAGHVFGLEHNQDPSSVMFESGLPMITQPSLNDLDALWAQFGQRSPDINEIDSAGQPLPNDTVNSATRIHYSDGYLGETPLINHADIGAADVDVYRFDAFDNGAMTGTVTFDARTRRLSQLQPRVRVFPEGSSQPLPDSDPNDGIFSAQLSDHERYYVVVDTTAVGLTAIGGYALVTTFDNYLVTSAATIDTYAGPEFRFLNQRQIEDVFQGDPEGVIPFFGNDLHLNDTLLTATPLMGPPGFIAGTRYQALASISDATDVDYYQIRSADFGPGAANIMSILVENVQGSNAPFEVTAYDRNGQILPHTNLINHGGRALIQLKNVQPDANHFLRIAARGGDTGNYRLSVISGTNAQSFMAWVAGTIPSESTSFQRTFYAPRTELTMFTFQGAATNSSSQIIRLSVETMAGAPMLEFVGAANSFISADSVILGRGIYRVTVQKLTELSIPMDFEINYFVITDPLAVPRLDLGNTAVVELAGFTDTFVFPQRGIGNGGNIDQVGGCGYDAAGLHSSELATHTIPTPVAPVRDDSGNGRIRNPRKPASDLQGELTLASQLSAWRAPA